MQKKIFEMGTIIILLLGIVNISFAYASDFELYTTKTQLTIGEIFKFNIDDATYSCNNENVLDISEDGTITAKAEGFAVIEVNKNDEIKKIGIMILPKDFILKEEKFDGTIDNSRFTDQYGGNTCVFTTDKSIDGEQSLYIDNSKSWGKIEYKIFNADNDGSPYPPNHISEFWFYDSLQDTNFVLMQYLFGKAGEDHERIQIGIKKDVNSEYYIADSLRYNAQWGISRPSLGFLPIEMKRSEGWHQIIINTLKENNIKLYLDGCLIYEFDLDGNYSSLYAMKMEIDQSSNKSTKVYFDNFKLFKFDSMPKINNLKISGIPTEGETYTANYDFYIANDNEDISEISWYRSETIDIDSKYNLIEGATEKEYVTTKKDNNRWLKVMVKPKTQSQTGDPIESEPYAAYMEPVAKNVRVKGVMDIGGSVTGEYTLFDGNNDNPVDNSTYKWYISDTFDGVYTEILCEDKLTYQLKDGEEDKFIKFEITPISGEKIGETVISPIPASTPSEPVAKQVKIVGESKIDAAIMGDYEYWDKNGDEEATSKFRWLRADQQNGVYNPIDDATKCEYTLCDDDAGKYIKFEVTPYSSIQPEKGETVLSEFFKCPMLPIAKNLEIKKINDILYGSYIYEQENGNIEGKSIYAWYVDGQKVSDDISYAINSDVYDKSVVFEIIPISLDKPYKGETKRVNTVISGPQLSGGGGVSGNRVQSNFVNNQVESPKEETITKEEPIFLDIKYHWAKNEIETMNKKGVAQGISDVMFMPDKMITRAEFITFAIRCFDFEEVEFKKIFNDVSENDWFSSYVLKAYENKIISKSDLFRPNDNITREEMTKVAVIAYEIKNGIIDKKGTSLSFSDLDQISSWAIDYIQKALTSNLINGISETTFSPKDNATRAQAVVILSRLWR